MTTIDIAELAQASTTASGVPLKVSDKNALGRVAVLVR